MSKVISCMDQPAVRQNKAVFSVSTAGKEKSVLHLPLDRIDARLVSLIAPESAEAERYRALRYEIEHLHDSNECAVVGVCSAIPGEGKTITALNLAGALAQNAKARVLLIEADLRRPAVTVGNKLAMGNNLSGHGLVDAILDPSLSLEEAVRHVPQFNLTILPAGKRSSAPYEILKSSRFGELLMLARRCYDYVIVDAPPVVPVSDCRVITEWVDGFVMVVAAHRTPKEALEEALTLMPPESILGLVFNGYDSSMNRYYGYGYGDTSGRDQVRWWRRLWG